MFYTMIKKLSVLLLFTLSLTFNNLLAQDITTVKAINSEIADNLDLKLLATLFGESKNLEEFEDKLNDYDIQASNLDLNNDNEVDYLRVIDVLEDGIHVIVIQAVIGIDKYQDVAEIDIQKNSEKLTEVQIVGDSSIYGENYIIEANYTATPQIFLWFWSLNYRVWYSPYFWGHYPKRYRHWRRCSKHKHRAKNKKYINFKTSYKFIKKRRNKKAKKIRRRHKKLIRKSLKKRSVRTNWKSNKNNSRNTKVYIHSSKKQNKPVKYKRSRGEKKSHWGTSNKKEQRKYRKKQNKNRKSYKKESKKESKNNKKRTYKTERKPKKAYKAKKSKSRKSGKKRRR